MKYLLQLAYLSFILLPVTANATDALQPVSIGKAHFVMEVADTPEKQETGLMFRKTLPQDQGMLFTFSPPDTVSMWMRNTYVPLDMVFVDKDNKVANLALHTIPLTDTPIPSSGLVSAVIELNAGTVKRSGIKTGDLVTYGKLP